MTGHHVRIYLVELRRRLTSPFSMRHYVYILLSAKDKRFYIGVSTNLKVRLQQHARGEVRSTKNRRYLKLIHYEYFINSVDAKARERFLKSGAGHEQLHSFLKRTLQEFL